VVLLIFYRGHWCLSCRRQLDRLAAEYGTLRAMRAELIAISADQPKSSREEQVSDRWPFPIVGDPELQVIDRYGVRDSSDSEGRRIARPSVFVLDPAGIVRYAHVGLHRQDRPALGSIMLALETLSGQRVT
jgi:peroxiredoxin